MARHPAPLAAFGLAFVFRLFSLTCVPMSACTAAVNYFSLLKIIRSPVNESSTVDRRRK